MANCVSIVYPERVLAVVVVLLIVSPFLDLGLSDSPDDDPPTRARCVKCRRGRSRRRSKRVERG